MRFARLVMDEVRKLACLGGRDEMPDQRHKPWMEDWVIIQVARIDVLV